MPSRQDASRTIIPRGAVDGALEELWGINRGSGVTVSNDEAREMVEDALLAAFRVMGFREEHKLGADGAGSSPPSPSDRPCSRYVRLVSHWRRER